VAEDEQHITQDGEGLQMEKMGGKKREMLGALSGRKQHWTSEHLGIRLNKERSPFAPTLREQEERGQKRKREDCSEARMKHLNREGLLISLGPDYSPGFGGSQRKEGGSASGPLLIDKEVRLTKSTQYHNGGSPNR
jgi:hypothetical protein